jgi:hypothetical protein
MFCARARRRSRPCHAGVGRALWRSSTTMLPLALRFRSPYGMGEVARHGAATSSMLGDEPVEESDGSARRHNRRLPITMRRGEGVARSLAPGECGMLPQLIRTTTVRVHQTDFVQLGLLGF